VPTRGTATHSGDLLVTRPGDPTSGFAGVLTSTVDFGAPKSIAMTASTITATDNVKIAMAGTLTGTGTITGNTFTSTLNGALTGGGETQQLALGAVGTFKLADAQSFYSTVTGIWTNLDFAAGTSVTGYGTGIKQEGRTRRGRRFVSSVRSFLMADAALPRQGLRPSRAWL
jgi:hypothetical protein